jgi:hypothetical protein
MKNLIKLDESFTLSNDANQWILEMAQTGDINTKTGKPTITRNKWYCTSIKTALNRYLNESTKTANSVLELVEIIKHSMDRIETLSQTINK